MIIQIRGTSGSGKTWTMRRLMEKLGPWANFMIEGRKKPLWYESEKGSIAVLGHYESTCGGCDNIGSAASVFKTIQECESDIILCEGLLLSEDVKWTVQMDDPLVVFLNTDVERCISQVKKRREEAGNTKTLNEHNTRNRVGVIERAAKRLEDAGVRCVRTTPERAVRGILKEINDAK